MKYFENFVLHFIQSIEVFLLWCFDNTIRSCEYGFAELKSKFQFNI